MDFRVRAGFLFFFFFSLFCELFIIVLFYTFFIFIFFTPDLAPVISLMTTVSPRVWEPLSGLWRSGFFFLSAALGRVQNRIRWRYTSAASMEVPILYNIILYLDTMARGLPRGAVGKRLVRTLCIVLYNIIPRYIIVYQLCTVKRACLKAKLPNGRITPRCVYCYSCGYWLPMEIVTYNSYCDTLPYHIIL